MNVKRKDYKETKAYLIVITFAITFAFVIILSFANEATKERIEKNQRLFLARAVLHAMDIEYTSDTDALAVFNQEIVQAEVDERTLFVNESEPKKYGIKFSGNGLWSTIKGVIAVDETLTRILGIDFIEQGETPGLGGRIEESWFKEQFQGEKIVNGTLLFAIGRSNPGDTNKENGSVDAITGATSTSKSLETILQRALKELIARVRK
jgi:Na+-transporting NADH:ubiquinone oxidoreductase subunit C